MPAATTTTAPLISTTLLPRADGSASFSLAGTTVLTSVNGPMEVRPRDELPSKAFIEMLVRPSSGVSGTREKLLESQLLAVVSPLIHRTYHPRTAIQLNVQIVEEGAEGNLLATAINSCVLALCDAGTPVKEMVAAANVGGVKEGKHTFAFGKDGSCVFSDSVAGEDGGFVEGDWEKRVAEAKELCTGEGQILKAMKEVLMAKVQKDLRWKDLADDGSIVDEMEEDA